MTCASTVKRIQLLFPLNWSSTVLCSWQQFLNVIAENVSKYQSLLSPLFSEMADFLHTNGTLKPEDNDKILQCLNLIFKRVFYESCVWSFREILNYFKFSTWYRTNLSSSINIVINNTKYYFNTHWLVKTEYSILMLCEILTFCTAYNTFVHFFRYFEFRTSY